MAGKARRGSLFQFARAEGGSRPARSAGVWRRVSSGGYLPSIWRRRFSGCEGFGSVSSALQRGFSDDLAEPERSGGSAGSAAVMPECSGGADLSDFANPTHSGGCPPPPAVSPECSGSALSSPMMPPECSGGTHPCLKYRRNVPATPPSLPESRRNVSDSRICLILDSRNVAEPVQRHRWIYRKITALVHRPRWRCRSVTESPPSPPGGRRNSTGLVIGMRDKGRESTAIIRRSRWNRHDSTRVVAGMPVWCRHATEASKNLRGRLKSNCKLVLVLFMTITDKAWDAHQRTVSKQFHRPRMGTD